MITPGIGFAAILFPPLPFHSAPPNLCSSSPDQFCLGLCLPTRPLRNHPAATCGHAAVQADLPDRIQPYPTVPRLPHTCGAGTAPGPTFTGGLPMTPCVYAYIHHRLYYLPHAWHARGDVGRRGLFPPGPHVALAYYPPRQALPPPATWWPHVQLIDVC